jgi:hypothetical protein
MPKAYWVVTYRSKKNPDAWKAYAKIAVPAIESAAAVFSRVAIRQKLTKPG